MRYIGKHEVFAPGVDTTCTPTAPGATPLPNITMSPGSYIFSVLALVFLLALDSLLFAYPLADLLTLIGLVPAV